MDADSERDRETFDGEIFVTPTGSFIERGTGQNTFFDDHDRDGAYVLITGVQFGGVVVPADADGSELQFISMKLRLQDTEDGEAYFSPVLCLPLDGVQLVLVDGLLKTAAVLEARAGGDAGDAGDAG